MDRTTAPAPPTPRLLRAAPPPSKRMYAQESWRSTDRMADELSATARSPCSPPRRRESTARRRQQ
eukprot:940913-Alexandrium_andersonii.AAC.1